MPAAIAGNTQIFARQSKNILLKASKLASSLAPNTVQIWPGGSKFTSIQAAIDSITDAGPKVEYQVAVGPGTYNENVTMKDYIYVAGAGISDTIITAGGQLNFASGVVNSAANAGIAELTIIAFGGSWGACPTGIKICGAGRFHISGVAINSSDSNQGGNNVRGITNNTGSYTGSVIIGSSNIQVSGVSDSTAVGIDGFGSPGGGAVTFFVELTSIVSKSLGQSFGVSLAVGASAILDDSKITASLWALYNSDGMSPIVANQCKIDGPVSAGVTVNN